MSKCYTESCYKVALCLLFKFLDGKLKSSEDFSAMGLRFNCICSVKLTLLKSLISVNIFVSNGFSYSLN